MKLYKLRALTNCDELNRIKEIISTNKFWCSRFHEMNDPMEGVYHTSRVDLIEKIYDEKESYKICSFSAKKGFENPVMWGYYASGFRGIAIEIEFDDNEVKKVCYVSKLAKNTNVNVLKVLTTKLNVWKHEAEYRYLKPNTCNLNQIGNIVKIYIGNPYNNINNESNVLRNNQVLQKYRILKAELEKFLRDKNIEFVEVYVENNIVVEREINS